MSKSTEDKIQAHDWKMLSQMRSAYLGEVAQTLWTDARSLELYDKFFGRRIADKWQSALRMVGDRGFVREFREWAAGAKQTVQVWDWGCGTGRASRTFLEQMALDAPVEVVLSDKVSFVEEWAWGQISESRLDLKRIKSSQLNISNFVLLVSHVLNELSSSQAGALSDVAARAEWIFWVENGSKSTSRQLSLVRNKIRHTHDILAPCLAQGSCPAVEGKGHTHWCHFFAERTANYFLDADWADFAKNLGVDLRSIPFSFFVARRKPSGEGSTALPVESANRGVRLGRGRLYKGYVDVLVCDQNAQLQDWRYPKKNHAQVYKDLKKELLPEVMDSPIVDHK